MPLYTKGKVKKKTTTKTSTDVVAKVKLVGQQLYSYDQAGKRTLIGEVNKKTTIVQEAEGVDVDAAVAYAVVFGGL